MAQRCGVRVRRARPSFRFWEAGGNWLRELGPAPAAPPPPPRGVGRADTGTLGLGSGRNALKRRRAAQRQRRPAERAPGTEERASGRAGGRAGRRASEARARLGPERALCSAKCQLRADGLGVHLPVGQAVSGNLRF